MQLLYGTNGWGGVCLGNYDLNNKTLVLPMEMKMKCLLSWEKAALKSLPTMQCHVGPYLLSNRRLIWLDMSFSSFKSAASSASFANSRASA